MASTWGDSWGISWSFSWDIGAPAPVTVGGGKSWKWKEGVKNLQNQNTKPHWTSDDVRKAASVLSKMGAAMGGHARAKSLTSIQRSSIAVKAANTRWKK